MQYCKCHNKLSFAEVNNALKDELKEFIAEPSLDEFSDIVYCLNRFAGTLLNKEYVPVVPGDGIHIRKIRERMEQYGCIRSRRHLVLGQCPSELDPSKRYIKVSIGRVVGVYNIPNDDFAMPQIGMHTPQLYSGIYEIGDDAKVVRQVEDF